MIDHRESFEDHGIKNHEKIEKRVILQRMKLAAECGLSDASALPIRDRDSKGPDSGFDRGNPGASEKASGDTKDRRDDSRDDRRDSRPSRKRSLSRSCSRSLL